VNNDTSCLLKEYQLVRVNKMYYPEIGGDRSCSSVHCRARTSTF